MPILYHERFKLSNRFINIGGEKGGMIYDETKQAYRFTVGDRDGGVGECYGMGGRAAGRERHRCF